MPLPEDQTHPAGAPAASGSSSAGANGLPPARDLGSVMDKFRQLGEEAEDDEEGEGEGEGSDDEVEGANGAGVTGDGAADGQGGEGGKKKKKKKKKSKAGKAVDKLKTIAGGQAPQQLVDTIRAEMDPSEQNASDDQIRQALKAVNLMKLLDGQQALGNKSNTKIIGEHKFWKTQPVPQLNIAPSSSSQTLTVPPVGAGASSSSSPGAGPSSSSGSAGAVVPGTSIVEGPIDPPKTVADVKQDPGALPAGFEWCLIDVKNDEQCAEVYTLLSENYVEDDDAMFRFRYSKEFLLWALTAPGYFPDWHIGVRAQKSGKLVAFISGIKVDIRVRNNSFPSAEINFLCVHKKLRSKRLTPVLIKEVTRRVNLQGIWQAVYTAGIVIPTPFSTCRYYHRNLNPVQLVDIGFSPLARGQTVARLARQLAVAPTTQIAGWREMQPRDVKKVGRLLTRYLQRFDIEQKFDGEEEVAHWFLSGAGKGEGREGRVVWAYVVENPQTGRITDLISFYSLPSSIMKHAVHKILNAAYMFYYATDSAFDENDEYFRYADDEGDDNATGQNGGPGPSAAASASTSLAGTRTAAQQKARLGERLNALVGDVMVEAKAAGFDVFNALTLMDNNLFLADQKFGAGDGFLNYYLYNWQCAPIDGGTRGGVAKSGSGIGVVML